MQRPRKTSPLTNLFRLHQAQRNLPPGIELVKADDFREWQVDIRVLDASPLYLNQTFRLNFTFSDTYPLGKFVSRGSCNLSDLCVPATPTAMIV
jgi:ubiquitin-protein ligase